MSTHELNHPLYMTIVAVEVTLREADDEDQVDDDPAQQVARYHVVNHHNERTNDLESSENFKPSLIHRKC